MHILACQATSGRFRHFRITCEESGSAPCIGGVSVGSRGKRLWRYWTDFHCRNLVSRIRARHDVLSRGYLREEPYAGKPPVRICEGEAEWPSYSTTPIIVVRRGFFAIVGPGNA